jgi:hypothetical protein
MRPTWTGETHPALAQVPRTPQQLQHLQRLQMQREQQQQPSLHSPNHQMVGPRPPVPSSVTQPPVQPAQPMFNNGSQQKTKVALQNMLSNRVTQPGLPVSHHPQVTGMAPDGTAANRLQMINLQQNPQMIRHPGQQPMFGPPPQRPPQGPQFMPMPPGGPVGQPPNMSPSGPHQMQMPPGSPHGTPHSMRYGPPVGMPQRPPVIGMPPQQPQPPRPPMPRPLFHGHDPATKRKNYF